MRRTDREVTDAKRIDEVIRACDCCRLGLRDGDGVYVVPMSFGYETENGKRAFYFHCAGEGRKLELLKANPNAGFELDTNHETVRAEKGCDFSFRYSSVIGKGTVATVPDTQEKKKALALIVSQYGGAGNWRFTDAEAARVTVLRLDVSEMACKEHR